MIKLYEFLHSKHWKKVGYFIAYQFVHFFLSEEEKLYRNVISILSEDFFNLFVDILWGSLNSLLCKNIDDPPKSWIRVEKNKKSVSWIICV